MHEDLEERIRACCQSEDYATAATLVIEHHGSDILALLISRLGTRTDADEVFGIFSEKLWMGLPGFEWRCRVKGWAYMLARNAANDFRGAAHNRAHRRIPLSQHPSLALLAERVRNTTANYRRTATRDRMRALRERLPPDDQMLLILRVDQELSWRDLVAAMADGSQPPDTATLDREASRMRKRFERVKTRLRELAVEDGLL